MGFRIELLGAEEAAAGVLGMFRDSSLAAQRAVSQGAQLMQRRISLRANTGQHAPNEGHIPGTGPGPNRATGNLLRNVVAEPAIMRTAGVWEAKAGVLSGAPYAEELEGGFAGQIGSRRQRTVMGGRVIARTSSGPPGKYPFFWMAVEESLPEIQVMFTEGVRRAMMAGDRFRTRSM